MRRGLGWGESNVEEVIVGWDRVKATYVEEVRVGWDGVKSEYHFNVH